MWIFNISHVKNNYDPTSYRSSAELNQFLMKVNGGQYGLPILKQQPSIDVLIFLNVVKKFLKNSYDFCCYSSFTLN